MPLTKIDCGRLFKAHPGIAKWDPILPPDNRDKTVFHENHLILKTENQYSEPLERRHASHFANVETYNGTFGVRPLLFKVFMASFMDD
jgi:hypothetical protein